MFLIPEKSALCDYWNYWTTEQYLLFRAIVIRSSRQRYLTSRFEEQFKS